jgi:hypothetical protein
MLGSGSEVGRPAPAAIVGLTCLFAIVLFSRLPFLDAGYGVNIDAWRIARAAREIATTGQYSVSRFPGYPVQEIISALFWRGDAWALNALSALFGAIAAVAFAAIARQLGCRDWFLGGLALAATPIVFVSSVCSKDYVWALAFILLSFLSALNGRAGAAGVCLGIATGCRLTSAAMLLPIALVLSHGTAWSWRRLGKFALISAGVTVIVFLPVWSRYGVGFFTFYGNHGRPDWPVILARSTVEVWGALGLAAMAMAAAAAWTNRKNIRLTSWPLFGSLVLTIGIYGAAYLRLPDQAGYLLPIVPAVLLLICLFTPRRWLQIAFCCLLFAAVVEPTATGLRPGAILADHEERIRDLLKLRTFLRFAESFPGRNVFVVGASEPQIAVLAPRLQNGRNHYVYALDASGIETASALGQSVYYLPGMREFNNRVTGIDLEQHGGLDLRRLSESKQLLINGAP